MPDLSALLFILATAGVLLIFLPVLVYICAKRWKYGSLMGQEQFLQDHYHPKENENGGQDCRSLRH